MRYLRPQWVVHQDDKSPLPGTIFTLDIQPSSERLATGGLDTRVRIWNTSHILDAAEPKTPPVSDSSSGGLLCTAVAHSGPVLILRWDSSGARLASGSDDCIVFIWQLDNSSNGLGKVWGSDDVNVESWKATRRLAGHESDVTSLAWSADDEYLASAGLDKVVIVWDGTTFDAIAKLDLHAGFIKGIAFDPVGQYLASQSDDKSCKIWRTSDWKLQHDITTPFEESPNAAFFMRLAWSPDGNYLVLPNSTNGPVFVSSVIDRKTFDSSTSLVGHDYIVQVVAFSPLIYVRDSSAPPEGSNICSVLALAARNSVSIWSTHRSAPICVAHDVLDRDVLDMSWSPDGLNLFVCSSDGHVCTFAFKPSEFPPVAPSGTRQKLFSTFNFTKPTRRRPEIPQTSVGSVQAPNVLVARKKTGPGESAPPGPPITTEQKVTIVNGRRRIQPAFLGSIGGSTGGLISSSAANLLSSSSSSSLPPNTTSSATSESKLANLDSRMTANGVFSNHNDAKQQQQQQQQQQDPFTKDFQLDWPVTSSSSIRLSDLQGDAPSNRIGLGRNDSKPDRPSSPPPIVFDLRPAYAPLPQTGPKGEPLHLAVPRATTFAYITAGDLRLEWRNFDTSDRPSEIWLKDTWLDYVHSHVVSATLTLHFSAVSLVDGSLIVYSSTGKRIIAPMLLDSPLSFIDSSEHSLLGITARGKLYMWNIRTRSIAFDPISVLDLICSKSDYSSPLPTIVSAQCRKNCRPIIVLSNGSVYTYDPGMRTWIVVSTAIWAQKSEFWEGRMRSSTVDSSRGVIRSIEGSVNDMIAADPRICRSLSSSSTLDKSSVMAVDEKPYNRNEPNGNDDGGEDKIVVITDDEDGVGDDDDQKVAISLAHLSSRMAAAITLESANEYRSSLMQYARKVADENMKNRAEEMAKELLGPVYFKPNRKDTWSPTVINIQKRDLLKEVLQIFSKQSSLTKISTTYKDLLNRVSAADTD